MPTSVRQNLSGAWRRMTTDPVGVLLPTAAALLVDVGVLGAARLAWDPTAPGRFAAIAAALGLARVLLGAPLRGLALAAGARAGGANARGASAAPALVVVELLTLTAGALVGGSFGGPIAGAGLFLASRGVVAPGVALAAAGAIVWATLDLVVRAALAYARPEVVVAGHGPFEALSRASEGAGPHIAALLAILFSGDVLRAAGSLACAAGALPAAPMADLAVLDRWQSERDA